MADNKIIHYIPPLSPKKEMRAGIYCCVSTNKVDQLKSLIAQPTSNRMISMDVLITLTFFESVTFPTDRNIIF